MNRSLFHSHALWRRVAPGALIGLAAVVTACSDEPSAPSAPRLVQPPSAAAAKSGPGKPDHAGPNNPKKDADRIAFSSGTALINRFIYTVNPDGSGLSQITNTDGDVNPSWSPDRRHIVFQRGLQLEQSRIIVVKSNGANQRDLGPGAEPAWSPDGKRIAFVRWTDNGAGFDIYVMNADGSNVIRVTTATAWDMSPTWSPDGKWLAFSTWDGTTTEIYKVRVDGLFRTKVTDCAPLQVVCEQPAWHPVGGDDRIAFRASPVGSSDRTIATIKADGTGYTPVVSVGSGNGDVAWSRDGSRLAFIADLAGAGYDIYTVLANGTDVQRVTFTTTYENSLAW